MTPQKTTATFTFTKDEYGICLFIDYVRKTYDITPKSGKREFKFLQGNITKPTSTKWIAISELIIDATKFAEGELGENKTTKGTVFIERRDNRQPNVFFSESGTRRIFVVIESQKDYWLAWEKTIDQNASYIVEAKIISDTEVEIIL